MYKAEYNYLNVRSPSQLNCGNICYSVLPCKCQWLFASELVSVVPKKSGNVS